MLHPKTMDDLRQPHTWEDLREYGFDGLWAPFQCLQFIMDSFELNGDTAIVKGWKRSVHQKFPPRETPQ